MIYGGRLTCGALVDPLLDDVLLVGVPIVRHDRVCHELEADGTRQTLQHHHRVHGSFPQILHRSAIKQHVVCQVIHTRASAPISMQHHLTESTGSLPPPTVPPCRPLLGLVHRQSPCPHQDLYWPPLHWPLPCSPPPFAPPSPHRQSRSTPVRRPEPGDKRKGVTTRPGSVHLKTVGKMHTHSPAHSLSLSIYLSIYIHFFSECSMPYLCVVTVLGWLKRRVG
jgi:hypothetical protein